MKALLDAGASVDLSDDRGWTALHWAAKVDFPEVSAIASRNFRFSLDGNEEGLPHKRLPMCIRTYDHARIVLLILQAVPQLVTAGIQVDARTDEDCTALHWAVVYSFDKVPSSGALSAACSGAMTQDTSGTSYRTICMQCQAERNDRVFTFNEHASAWVRAAALAASAARLAAATVARQEARRPGAVWRAGRGTPAGWRGRRECHLWGEQQHSAAACGAEQLAQGARLGASTLLGPVFQAVQQSIAHGSAGTHDMERAASEAADTLPVSTGLAKFAGLLTP